MTGTAASDAKELNDVYSLIVVPIPTALPVARKDYDDAVYQTIDAKNRAAAARSRQHRKPARFGRYDVRRAGTRSWNGSGVTWFGL